MRGHQAEDGNIGEFVPLVIINLFFSIILGGQWLLLSVGGETLKQQLENNLYPLTQSRLTNNVKF